MTASVEFSLEMLRWWKVKIFATTAKAVAHNGPHSKHFDRFNGKSNLLVPSGKNICSVVYCETLPSHDKKDSERY